MAAHTTLATFSKTIAVDTTPKDLAFIDDRRTSNLSIPVTYDDPLTGNVFTINQMFTSILLINYGPDPLYACIERDPADKIDFTNPGIGALDTVITLVAGAQELFTGRAIARLRLVSGGNSSTGIQMEQ